MKNISKYSLRFFLKHIGRFKWLFAIMVISIVIGTIMEVITPIYYKQIFDLFVETGVDKSSLVAQMFEYVKVIAALMVVMFISWRINEFSSNYLQSKAMRNIANECFEYLNHHSYRFFSDHFSGSLVRKVGRLMWAFNKFMDKIYWDFTTVIVRVIAILAVVFWFSPLLAWILLGWIVIFAIATLLFARWKFPSEVYASKRDSMLSGNLADVITNTVNVKLFTAHEAELKSFGKNTEEWKRARKRAWDLGSYFNAGQGFFMLALEIVIVVLTIKLWEQDLVTIGFLFLIQGYVLGLFYRLWDLKWMIQGIFDAFADAKEMMDILHTPHEIVDVPGAGKLEVIEGKIEFRKVRFGYLPEQPVLKNFNITIQPGEKIALVGHSGEGKSTITTLLMRLFDIQKGEIFIDDQNIAEVTLKSLRGNISLVPQDPLLFHRSLIENIRYGKPKASKGEVIKAAKLANCHEFISKLKKGYRTMVGERGIKLSGGERQRVAIARAILEDSPVVILDEATSSLDSHSEKMIQQALHRLLKGKTAIIIAHRLSTIMESDRILVVRKGKVVEQGTHRSLLRRRKGIYRHLWEIQAGGFIGE